MTRVVTIFNMFCRVTDISDKSDKSDRTDKTDKTEDYKPTDNAIAERVNGILKTEVIYRERRFKTILDACERIASFILFYNDRRPHASIGMKTPAEAHQEQGPQRKMWSTPMLSGAVCPLPQGTP